MKSSLFADIAEAVRERRSVTVSGLWGSADAYLLGQIFSALPKARRTAVTLFLTLTVETAEMLREDLLTFLGTEHSAPAYFPFSETGDITVESEIFRQRLVVLNRLNTAAVKDLLVIAPLPALKQSVPAPEELTLHRLHLKTGDALDTGKLFSALAEAGFTRRTEVTAPAEYAQRGGIIDVFSPDAAEPVRIELAGTQIDSLRNFNPVTQLSLRPLKSAYLLLNRLDKRESSLLDYLPADTLIVYQEPRQIKEILGQSTDGPEILRRLSVYPALEFMVLPPSADAVSGQAPARFNFQITSLQRFSGRLTDLAGDLSTLTQKGLRLQIFCPHESEITRLKELLTALRQDSGQAEELKSARINIILGRLNTGFIFPEIATAFISYNELFNRYRQPRPFRETAAGAEPLEPFQELAKEDFAVHLKYGIGRYQGIERLDKDGFTQEYHVLEYQNRARVYVPMHQSELIEKYIGGTDRAPELSRLGTELWELKKERVRQAVTRFAREFLEIQALRATQEGTAFPLDTEWQAEFEASFPYEETPDQLTINNEIKQDLLSSYPMDRLICGDVGYGKTELAMRAAFKVATAGHQVAVLVPTTVLAQQHYQTFQERTADYPVNIEMLSRFRTRPQQQEIIARLKEGAVDIIIGTHRLLQPDIRFKNLGLIIIDEEQRFGVEHKERLKRLKALVDTLTLTATPIPRTLHMSLLGIRDISNLNTPPLDRRAVVTRIINFDDEVIRSAIRRELARQGQIYFVHNRIYDIRPIAERLQTLVPEVRLAVAHGQLPEEELEERMKEFVEGRIDMLVSTNIIESGLDIPRANTIFINNAENFGLADLHQLRGRVGRYKHQAYAYLVISEGSIPLDATKRLKAITEFNELGAGFKIALRDMEIRGVGNILGREQHGYIATVGYELYRRLLENAVRIIKIGRGAKDEGRQMADTAEREITIELRLNAYLPADYVPSEKQRLDFYRRLSRITVAAELTKIRAEIIDRFGSPVPPEVENLLTITRLKLLARQHSFTSLIQSKEESSFVTGPVIIIQYLNYAKARRLQQRYPQLIWIIDGKTLHFNLPTGTNPTRVADELIRILQED